MFGAPLNVPLVGCKALIAPVSYVQWLQVVVGDLSIPHRAMGVKFRGIGLRGSVLGGGRGRRKNYESVGLTPRS